MSTHVRKMNITVPIKWGRDNDKTFWHNIGTAFENDKGQITCYLNSLPLPDEDGKVKFMLFEKKEGDEDRGSARSTRNGGSSSKSRKPSSSKTRGEDMDDEIPF